MSLWPFWQTCPERDAAAWLRLCWCALCLPSGGSVQHLVHHRPGGPGPSLALHGGRRGHVHSGLCRMHRSTPGKHVSTQVCMFHDKASSFHAAVMNAWEIVSIANDLSAHHFLSSCCSSLCFWESSFSWSWQRESWHLSLRTGLKTSSTCSSTITSGRTGTTSICRTSSISLRNTYVESSSYTLEIIVWQNNMHTNFPH